ncbi:hypothetical protein BJ508DRAFT_332279 [Ascobolus immersus RN42]|uniref:Uncharacterized protein n=1 Tax=Ascobolus immersus RN42 TaxID=1160509 RepID=A0A3N4HTB6_ASCIM|nr:hypothetical protein BJ508DRAFT_332279 [Ascobolus immersus RN42]
MINTSALPPRARTTSTPTRSSFPRRDSYGYGTPPLTPASSRSSGQYQMASNFSPPIPQAPQITPSRPSAPEGYFFPKPRQLHYEPEEMSEPETEDFVESPDPYSGTSLGRYKSFYHGEDERGGSGSYWGAAVTPGPYPGGGIGVVGATYGSYGASHGAPSQVWSDTSQRSRQSTGSGGSAVEQAWADY